MAERVAFLLGKDPVISFGGDMTMFRTMQAIAAERYDTEVICLSEEPERTDSDPHFPIVRVAKPALSWPSLARKSLLGRRSALHARFDVDAMRIAIEQSDAERFVAVHCHLAEPYLRAAGVDPQRDLLVSTEILESEIWPKIHGFAGRVEAPRLRRDEDRVIGAARAVAGYDRDEMDGFRARGIDARWLPMTLPPATQVNVANSPPRLVMLGHRGWGPNAAAAETIVRLWPAIQEGIPDAELVLVGPPPEGQAAPLPPGVTDLGLVENVDAILGTARALTAPVGVGGGVRVKLLEAASRGIPAVCTTEAVGSIEAALGLSAAPNEVEFVAHCRSLLADADAAAAEGAQLYATNQRFWSERIGRDAVLDWLAT
jgi:hypothetical protein